METQPGSCLLVRYPKETKAKLNHVKTKKASSFHEFARSTNDAWDLEDEDEDEFLAIAEPSPSPAVAVARSPPTGGKKVFQPQLEGLGVVAW